MILAIGEPILLKGGYVRAYLAERIVYLMMATRNHVAIG